MEQCLLMPALRAFRFASKTFVLSCFMLAIA
jgi:hypothetical protein